MATLSRRWRLGLGAFALLQMILTSGSIFGWGSLVLVLKSKGVYAWRCGAEVACREQDLALARMMSAAITAALTSSLPTGIVLDYIGPRRTTLLGLALQFGGALLLAFSGAELDLYVAAYALLGAGSPGIQISTMHVSQLFPGHEGTMLALLNGCYDASSLVFLVFLAADRALAGAPPLREMFLVYALAVVLPVALVGLVVWPDRAFDRSAAGTDATGSSTADDAAPTADACGHKEAGRGRTEGDAAVAGVEVAPAQLASCSSAWRRSWCADGATRPPGAAFGTAAFARLPLRWQLRSSQLALCALFFSTSLLRFSFYMASMPEQLSYLSALTGVDSAPFGTSFGYILPLATLSAPVAGKVVDHFGIEVTLCVTSLLAIAHGAVCLVPSLPAQVGAFVLFGVFRAFLFTSVSAWIAAHFGFVTFGRIFGLLATVAALVGICQYPLIELAAEGGHGFRTATSIVLGGTCLGLSFHATHCFSRARRCARDTRQARGRARACESVSGCPSASGATAEQA